MTTVFSVMPVGNVSSNANNVCKINVWVLNVSVLILRRNVITYLLNSQSESSRARTTVVAIHYIQYTYVYITDITHVHYITHITDIRYVHYPHY